MPLQHSLSCKLAPIPKWHHTKMAGGVHKDTGEKFSRGQAHCPSVQSHVDVMVCRIVKGDVLNSSCMKFGESTTCCAGKAYKSSLATPRLITIMYMTCHIDAAAATLLLSSALPLQCDKLSYEAWQNAGPEVDTGNWAPDINACTAFSRPVEPA